MIVLILFEIILGIYGTRLAIKQGADEDKLMDKQNGILSSMQTSASTTAGTLDRLAATMSTMDSSAAATAKTLRALQATTETMNGAIQGQLALFYDISLNITYDNPSKKLNIFNTGRTNVILWAVSPTFAVEATSAS